MPGGESELWESPAPPLDAEHVCVSESRLPTLPCAEWEQSSAVQWE